MKKIIVFFLSLFLYVVAQAQYDTTPPYLKTKWLPSFSLLSIDSIPFTQNVLDKNKSSIIMLFNPTCEHCQKQLKQILSMSEEMEKSVNLILSSTESLEKIKIFYNKYHLQKYSWIYLCKDYLYLFGKFYQPKTTPVLAFYNVQNQLVFFNQGTVTKEQIISVLNNKALP